MSDSSAPVTHQVQGFWELSSTGSDLPPLAILIAPENYHAASKVIGSQILWLSLFGGQPDCGSRRGRTIESQHRRVVHMIRDGVAANRTMVLNKETNKRVGSLFLLIGRKMATSSPYGRTDMKAVKVESDGSIKLPVEMRRLFPFNRIGGTAKYRYRSCAAINFPMRRELKLRRPSRRARIETIREPETPFGEIKILSRLDSGGAFRSSRTRRPWC